MTTYLTEDEKALAKTFIDSRTQFVEQGLKPTLAALRGQDAEAAKAAAPGPMTELYLPARNNMQSLIKMQIDVARQEYAGALARYEHARNLAIALNVVGGALGAAVAFFLIRGIGAAIGQALHLAQSLADGDLTQTVRIDSNDEIGRLLAALQKMNASLVGSMHEVSVAVVQMDQVTQQNAALVEEAAAAAEAMLDQATSLAQAVSVFRTGEGMTRQPMLLG